MPAVSPSIPPVPGGGDAGEEAAEMAARIASGPGFWTQWLSDLGREGLLEQLLADGVIGRALREAPAGHKYDRALNAKMTVVCVLVACLFPGAGYDSVLATAFGLPGLRRPPGADVPTGAAFSQARKLLGEQVMRKIFELDAAVPDADLGAGLPWRGLEVTAIDGTTMELARNDVLEGEFGTPGDGARPLLRVTAHVRTATFRWIGAAINPALRPSNSIYIGLPVISGINLNINNNFVNFSDALIKGQPKDSIISFLHPDYNVDKFLAKIKDKNFFNPESMIQLLGVGFSVGKDGYVFFDINDRMESNIVLPGDLFRLALKGNEGFSGSKIDLSSLRADIKYNREFGAGFPEYYR